MTVENKLSQKSWNWYCTTTKEKYKNVVNKDGIDNQKVIPVDRWKNKLSQLELSLYIYFF